MSIRIIPRLDIKGPNLVKGIHLEGLRVLGKPEDFARYYYEGEADELVYMDAVASLYQRNNLLEIVSKAAREIFIPLTVGGGLRTLDDIRDILRAGADKVALNTAAIARPAFIKEASRQFGSSTIVVSIDAIKKPDGTYEACTNYGRDASGLNACDWAIQAANLGAGELMITSINEEGTGKGFDLELTRIVSESVNVPVIACGGAGNLSHISDVIEHGKADAVSLASILHYSCFDKLQRQSSDYSDEGNTVFMRLEGSRPRLDSVTLSDIKKHLRDYGIDCRPPNHDRYHE